MGAVHKETPGQNIGYHEFENVTLSDSRCVSFLIRFRSKIYPPDRAMTHFSDIMVLLYTDLDTILLKTSLTTHQRETVKYLMLGYSIQDLSELWNESPKAIENYLHKASVRLAKINAINNRSILEKRWHNIIIG